MLEPSSTTPLPLPWLRFAAWGFTCSEWVHLLWMGSPGPIRWRDRHFRDVCKLWWGSSYSLILRYPSCLFICLSLHSFTLYIYSFLFIFIHFVVHLAISFFIVLPTYLSVHLPNTLSLYSFSSAHVYSFCPFISLFIYSFIFAFIYPFLSARVSLLPFRHWFINFP